MYRPPTFLRTLVIAIVICAGFFVIQRFTHFRFAELSETQRLLAGQWGVVLSYLAAIIAMLGLFHDTQVAEHRIKLEAEKRGIQEQLELLTSLANELKHDLSGSVTSLTERAVSVERELVPFASYPRAMKSTYWLAGLVLAVGATAQLMGLG